MKFIHVCIWNSSHQFKQWEITTIFNEDTWTYDFQRVSSISELPILYLYGVMAWKAPPKSLKNVKNPSHGTDVIFEHAHLSGRTHKIWRKSPERREISQQNILPKDEMDVRHTLKQQSNSKTHRLPSKITNRFWGFRSPGSGHTFENTFSILPRYDYLSCTDDIR